MLKCYQIALSIVLMVAVTSDSQAQSSRHQTPANQTQKTNRNPAADQRGTPNQPLTVNVVPTAEQKALSEQQSTKAEVKDDRLVSYTGDLVLVGVVQFAVFVLQLIAFSVQAFYMRRSVIEMRRTTHATIRSTRAAQKAANAAEKQVRVMAAVEGPVPVVPGIKLVPYALIPGATRIGETALADHVNPGRIPANCRILIAIENKGRTVLRLREFCIDKFIGTALPAPPTYNHIEPLDFFLEKGPIWFKTSDNLANVTPAEVGAAAAVYPNGAFWVYGYFAYYNLLNERIEHKFLFRWDLQIGFVSEARAGYT
jgi:hypothetical protein